MAYIRYYQKSCPTCGKVYSTSTAQDVQRVGSPVFNCKRCTNPIIDKNYKEPAAFKWEKTFPVTWYPSHKWIVCCFPLFIMFLAIIYDNTGWEWTTILLTFMSSIATFSAIRLVVLKMGFKNRVRKWMQAYKESYIRLQNEEYKMLLIRIYANEADLIIDKPYTEQQNVMYGESFKTAFHRITLGKGLKKKLIVKVLCFIAMISTLMFTIFSDNTQMKEAVDYKKAESDGYVQLEGTMLGELAYETLNDNKLGISYWLMSYDDEFVVVKLNSQQEKLYGQEGQNVKVYGTVESIPDELITYLLAEYAEIFAEDILTFTDIIGKECVSILDEPLKELSDMTSVIGVITVLLWIVAIVVSFQYMRRYGAIIRTIQTEISFRDYA